MKYWIGILRPDSTGESGYIYASEHDLPGDYVEVVELSAYTNLQIEVLRLRKALDYAKDQFRDLNPTYAADTAYYETEKLERGEE